MTDQSETHVDRMKAELSELEERLAKLIAFTRTPTFADLPEVKRYWMTKQLNAMTDYEMALRHRLTLEEPVAETAAQA